MEGLYHKDAFFLSIPHPSPQYWSQGLQVLWGQELFLRDLLPACSAFSLGLPLCPVCFPLYLFPVCVGRGPVS